MSLLLEDPRNVRRYIEDQALRRTLWGFEHIPKTAGSSLVALLNEGLPPYHNIVPKTYHVGPPDFRALRMQAVQDFIAVQTQRPEAARFRSFSGHLFRNDLDLIRETIPEVRLFALLRHPVARAISDYRYCLTPAHPTHVEFAAKYPTLLDYVSDPRNQNIVTKMLMLYDPATNKRGILTMTPTAVFDAVLPYFEFIGTQERYEDSLGIVRAMTGVNGAATSRRINVTVETPANRIDMDVSLAEKIRAANALDEALYDEVDRRLAPRIEAWRAAS